MKNQETKETNKKIPFPVFQEIHYGEVVWVSLIGELGVNPLDLNGKFGRCNGCLCINGCKKIAGNLKWEKEKKGQLPNGTELNKKIDAPLEIEDLINASLVNEVRDFLKWDPKILKKHYFDQSCAGYCPLAMLFYLGCRLGNTALAVTRCKYFSPDPDSNVQVMMNGYLYSRTFVHSGTGSAQEESVLKNLAPAGLNLAKIEADEIDVLKISSSDGTVQNRKLIPIIFLLNENGNATNITVVGELEELPEVKIKIW